MHTIVNVANRLPVTFGRGIRKSGGGLVSALSGVESWARLVWVGWPGTDVQDPARREQLEAYCGKHDLCPVYVSERESHNYYMGFSNSSVWPVLHYMPDHMRYDRAWWDDYQKINARFAGRVLEIAGADDLVWVHDYQLMLLPAMLREARPGMKIGFFLHTPFPSYEVFRCHPNRERLLEGVLGADQIGFHTFGYLRHFRSTVLRLLGLESEMNHIVHARGRTRIGVYPIGINARQFSAELESDRFARRLEEYRRAHAGKRVVLSVERLDYTKGISRRLEAVDLFLSTCESVDKVVFIFVSVPSRQDVPEYQALRHRVERQVGQINGRHATMMNTPVHFIYKSIGFTELCALYALADVALITPLRDGMNLVAKEYVACQKDGSGALILSEFAGASQELFSATQVNAYDIHAVAGRISEALAMPSEAKAAKMRQMRARVLQYDADYWARSFITDLARPRPAADEQHEVIEGAGTVTEVAERLSAAQSIACFLDYDGTLREFETDPGAAVPTAEILELLDRLLSCPRMATYLISGRNSRDLAEWFTDERLGLIAEHGFSLKLPGQSEWEVLGDAQDMSWKERVFEVLHLYEGNTPGSTVEEKSSSLVWHYRRADPEFGRSKAHQLVSDLSEAAANLPVEVRHGKKIVEVSSVHVNKGTAVARCLREATCDVVLCAGDDQTDESMFRLKRADLLTVKVGPGGTEAHYRVAGPAAFRKLLGKVLDVIS